MIAEKIPAPRGGVVVVPIVVSNNKEGIAAVGFDVSYNSSILTLRGDVRSERTELPVNRFRLNPVPQQGTQWVSQWISLINEDDPMPENFNGNGDLVILRFDVNKNATVGVESEVRLAFTSPSHADGHPATAVGSGRNFSSNLIPGALAFPGSVIITETDGSGGGDDGGTGPYTVTFDPAGGTRTGGGQLIQTVQRGSNAEAPTVTRTGYTFTRWEGSYTNVLSNRSITAVWSQGGTGGGGNGSGGGDGTGGGGNGSGGGGASPSPSPGTSPSPSPSPGTGAGGIRVITDFGTWVGSGTSTAKLDAEKSEFVRLKLGDNVVSETHYTVAAGSTLITLNEAYLKTLDDGTYKYRAEFTNNRYADLTLIVSSTFGNVPQTSVIDITGSVVIMWASIFITAFLGVYLYFHIKERRRGKIFDILRHGK